MKTHKTRTVAYRRKREGKTHYRKRLKLIMSGKPRLVVRKSLKNILAQIVDYNEKGDKVLVSVNSRELSSFGWNYNYTNLPSAYLLGLLISKRSLEKGIKEAILDIGLCKSIPNSRLYAVLKGAVDNGLIIPHSESVLPDEARIRGKHIEDYANKLKASQDEFRRQFSGYLKKNIDITSITKKFVEIKSRIIGA